MSRFPGVFSVKRRIKWQHREFRDLPGAAGRARANLRKDNDLGPGRVLEGCKRREASNGINFSAEADLRLRGVISFEGKFCT